jgi:predicted glycoside hydrolase/deacetylase ChbG (UPF0249 family)
VANKKSFKPYLLKVTRQHDMLVYGETYPKLQLGLIINADDLGLDPEADENILKGFDQGIVTSASLLVTPIREEDKVDGVLSHSFFHRLEETVRRAQRVKFPIGLHLNLTEGQPLSSFSSSSILTTSSPSTQFFRGKFGFRSIVSTTLDSSSSSSSLKLSREIQMEITAQYSMFISLTNGIPPTHVDGHQHCQIVTGIPQIIAPILSNLGLKHIRIPNEDLNHLLQSSSSTFFSEDDDPRTSFHIQVSQQAFASRSIFFSHGLRTTTHFLGLQLMNAPQGTRGLQQALQRLLTSPLSSSSSSTSSQRISCELMVHIGFISQEQKGSNEGDLGDVLNSTINFCMLPGRLAELECILHPETRKLCSSPSVSSSIQLLSWQDFDRFHQSTQIPS